MKPLPSLANPSTTDEPEPDQIAAPALFRASRGAYPHAIRAQLMNGGFEDLSRNPFVLGGMASHGGQLAQLCTPEEIAGLRVGLQALCEIRERMQAQS